MAVLAGHECEVRGRHPAGEQLHIWWLHPLIAINYFAMFVVLVGYPIAVFRALAAHRLFPALVSHLVVLVLFGMYYRWRVRAWPEHQRVGALAFVPQALVMPVTYALLTPLALFTLDSASWETRGHDALAPAPGGELAPTAPPI